MISDGDYEDDDEDDNEGRLGDSSTREGGDGFTVRRATCSFRLSKLEEQRAHAAHLALFLDEDLEVLVDDGDGEENSGSGPDGAHEVGQHGQRADAQTAERSRSGNVAIQLVNHGFFAMSSHDHLLFLQLLGDVLGRRTGDIDPRLGEKRARAQHEHDVQNSVHRILEHMREAFWWR